MSVPTLCVSFGQNVFGLFNFSLISGTFWQDNHKKESFVQDMKNPMTDEKYYN